MSKFTNKKFIMSVKHAIDGVYATLKSQRNFRYQILMMFGICVLAYFFEYSLIEFLICFFSIILVLIMEMINSCIEFTLDAVYKNKYSTLVKLSKDISAGAVLISSLNCAFVNGLVFISKFF